MKQSTHSLNSQKPVNMGVIWRWWVVHKCCCWESPTLQGLCHPKKIRDHFLQCGIPPTLLGNATTTFYKLHNPRIHLSLLGTLQSDPYWPVCPCRGRAIVGHLEICRNIQCQVVGNTSHMNPTPDQPLPAPPSHVPISPPITPQKPPRVPFHVTSLRFISTAPPTSLTTNISVIFPPDSTIIYPDTNNTFLHRYPNNSHLNTISQKS